MNLATDNALLSEYDLHLNWLRSSNIVSLSDLLVSEIKSSEDPDTTFKLHFWDFLFVLGAPPGQLRVSIVIKLFKLRPL